MVVIILVIHKKRKQNSYKSVVLHRAREFDACVCYAFDGDNDYVMETVLPELEENHNPPFKLSLHSRDFDPGLRIFDNIRRAIESSNSAIIILSQAFVNSVWCKAEFEQCFIENMNDAAFRLFVILMQDSDTLMEMTEYMKTFIEQRTYLDRDDPDLFVKISKYLTEVRQVEGANDINDNDEVDNSKVANDNDDTNNVIDVCDVIDNNSAIKKANDVKDNATDG